MKRIGIIGLLLALVGMLGLQSCDDEREISYGKLPSLARAFIETYFPDQSVSYAERDKDDGRREYSVVLSNGTEIDFDQNGDWESVDCKFSVLPEGIVPQSIAEVCNPLPGCQGIQDRATAWRLRTLHWPRPGVGLRRGRDLYSGTIRLNGTCTSGITGALQRRSRSHCGAGSPKIKIKNAQFPKISNPLQNRYRSLYQDK